MNKKLSLIVPVYNEEVNCKKNLSKIYKFSEKNLKKFEMIIVESGSIDNTYNICKKFSKNFKFIKLSKQKKRYGFGSAIKKGIKLSTGSHFCIVPIDLCYNLNHLKKFLKNDFDFLLSYRSNDQRSFKRKAYSFFFEKFINFVFLLNEKSINCAPKILPIKLFKREKIYSNGWLIDTEFLYILKNKKLKKK